MVAIGGDHSISYPLGRGMEASGAFDVVHVDAHTDFLDELDGARLTGASQLRRLAELPFVGTVTALGVRNVDRAEVDGMRELGGRWATSLDVIERGAGEVVRETVPEAEALYVSIDLDVLDSSIAPGHSLPEPGGLSYRQLRAILVEVARRGRVIGFDVVELNPRARPLRGDRARGHLDRHALPERDLRSATLSAASRSLAVGRRRGCLRQRAPVGQAAAGHPSLPDRGARRRRRDRGAVDEPMSSPPSRRAISCSCSVQRLRSTTTPAKPTSP